MKILFTGFTSRTIGSDRNVYDYMCNVDVLRRTLEMAGHTVDQRSVSVSESDLASRYDVALVGIAALQGLSSRYKLSGLWTLAQFGQRAAIFPSDGKNIYIFPSSIRTCRTGDHNMDGEKISPLDYMLGALQRERNNVIEAEEGGLFDPANPNREVWQSVLDRLPFDEKKPECAWKILIPTHAWGRPREYSRHLGGEVTVWDPTNVAIPMQFSNEEFADDGRLFQAQDNSTRQRQWVISSLQDNSAWVKKQKPKWPVISVGNKRSARDGEGDFYVPERQLIETYYAQNWGHLAFGYPLGEGGWWRMRYVHAALAGIVTCCDEADARPMPQSYRHYRSDLERWSDEKLAAIAKQQHSELMAASWPADRAVRVVDDFVRSLAS